MKKPALGGEKFYANAEDVNGFDPFSAILRIIQSAPGTYTIPNAKAVEDNIGKIEDEINSGKTPVVDLVGDLGTNNNNAMTLERFVEILKDGKADQKGVLRFYAESDSVRHNLSFLENLVATNGVIVQKDGWIYVRNIGAANLPMLEKILEKGARIRTNKGTNLEHTDKFVADEYELTEEVKEFPNKLSQIPKWKSGAKTTFTVNGGAVDILTENEMPRIGQKSVNGTPAFPNPDILIKDRYGKMSDIPCRKFDELNQVDDSLKYGVINRIYGHQMMFNSDPRYIQMGLGRTIVQFAEDADRELQYYSDASHMGSFVNGKLVADGTAGAERIPFVHMQSMALRDAVIGPFTYIGEERGFYFDLTKYCIVVPDSLMPAIHTSDWVFDMYFTLMDICTVNFNGYPNFGAGNSLYYISESQFKEMQKNNGKKMRLMPFTGWEPYLWRLEQYVE